MTATCFTPIRVPRIRVTKLNSCGQVVTGSCSQVVSDGIISIEMTKNYEARQEFFVKNGDGFFCVKETIPPVLKWINLVITFCGVSPDLLQLMTGETLYQDNDAAGTNIGYSSEETSASTVNFAFEGWTRIANAGVPCTGGTQYGYLLYPWCVEGTIGDMKFENGTTNFVVNARTRSNSLWGVGPYNVALSDNPGTYDTPIPMLTPMGSTQHHRMFLTRLAPPAASCNCASV